MACSGSQVVLREVALAESWGDWREASRWGLRRSSTASAERRLAALGSSRTARKVQGLRCRTQRPTSIPQPRSGCASSLKGGAQAAQQEHDSKHERRSECEP